MDVAKEHELIEHKLGMMSSYLRYAILMHDHGYDPYFWIEKAEGAFEDARERLSAVKAELDRRDADSRK